MGKLEAVLSWAERNPGMTALFMLFCIVVLGIAMAGK
jgi:hypothetical protein